MMSKESPPPQRHPKIYHFVRAGLCIAEVRHNDQFQPSSYESKSTGLCRARDPMGCQLTGSIETLCLLELPQIHF